MGLVMCFTNGLKQTELFKRLFSHISGCGAYISGYDA